MFTNWLTDTTFTNNNTHKSTEANRDNNTLTSNERNANNTTLNCFTHQQNQQQHHHHHHHEQLLPTNNTIVVAAAAATSILQHPPDVILQMGPTEATTAAATVPPTSATPDAISFLAHSLILGMHSGYLRSATRFDETAIENRNRNNNNRDSMTTIYLTNVTAEQFAPLLTYMYTGYLDLNIENIFGILLATHVLHMPRALEICRSFLTRAQTEDYFNINLSSTANNLNLHGNAVNRNNNNRNNNSNCNDTAGKIIRPIASKAIIQNFGFLPTQQHQQLPTNAFQPTGPTATMAPIQYINANDHSSIIAPLLSTASTEEQEQKAQTPIDVDQCSMQSGIIPPPPTTITTISAREKTSQNDNVVGGDSSVADDDEDEEVFIDTNTEIDYELEQERIAKWRQTLEQQIAKASMNNYQNGAGASDDDDDDDREIIVTIENPRRETTIKRNKYTHRSQRAATGGSRSGGGGCSTHHSNSQQQKSVRRNGAGQQQQQSDKRQDRRNNNNNNNNSNSSTSKNQKYNQRLRSTSGLQTAKAPIPASQLDANEGSKVIIDVASCDGPVRFRRILNTAYGHKPDGSFASNVYATNDVIYQERTQQSLCSSFHQQMAKTISQQRQLQRVDESENSESSGSTKQSLHHQQPQQQQQQQHKNYYHQHHHGSGTAIVGNNEMYICVYCKHTFKSQYCYQKHAKRHLNPLGLNATTTAAAILNEDGYAPESDKVIITKNLNPNYGRPIASAATTSSNQTMDKNTSTTRLVQRNQTEMLRREVRPLDMNVQYYPCKTCGSKFPSYYFVHKHRKLCHADEETEQQQQQQQRSTAILNGYTRNKVGKLQRPQNTRIYNGETSPTATTTNQEDESVAVDQETEQTKTKGDDRTNADEN